MGRLAGVSGREAVRRFGRIGYLIVHQRGSHVRLRNTDHVRHRPLTIPMHRELKSGLLRQLIRDAGITVDAFLKL